MMGYEDYQKQLYENYPKNAWLTPSEIFKPYYGLSIANYINTVLEKEQHDKSKLNIVEGGAGTGAAAESILTYFKQFEYETYCKMNYTIIELSPVLCRQSRELLQSQHGVMLQQNRLKIINDDILSYRNTQDYTFMILLEVLDNMPHDRLFRNHPKAKWDTMAMIEFNNQDQPVEHKVPIDDELILELLNIRHKYEQTQPAEQKKLIERISDYYYSNKNNHSLFLPTYCYKFLKRLNFNVPKHHLILADFDSLKCKASLKMGLNAPIVSKKGEESSEHYDFDTYLVKRGEADIFFPTDFNFLKIMYRQATGKHSTNSKTHLFLDQYSRTKWTSTQSGYNPLKEDFSNTQILVTNAYAPPNSQSFSYS